MSTILSPRRRIAAFLCWCAVCASPVLAQRSDPALPPPSPPPLTAPGDPEDAALEKRLRERMRAAEKARQTPADEFVPVSELPPEEQLPAAPMLVAAYVFVVLALFAYLLSVSRRLGTVKQEIARLEADTRRSGQR